MPDYAKMYRYLFNIQTQIIEMLQEAQRETEEMYISAVEPELIVLDTADKDDEA